MPIIYKNGDVIDAFENLNFNILMHGCNCFCTMGAGIAAQIRKKYPIVYEKDLQTKKGDESKLGTIDIIKVNDKNQFIVNAYTQFYYGKYKDNVSYNAIHNVFSEIYKFCKDNYYSICIPKIGAGLAGGDWSKIEKIIYDIFDERDIYVFSLN